MLRCLLLLTRCQCCTRAHTLMRGSRQQVYLAAQKAGLSCQMACGRTCCCGCPPCSLAYCLPRPSWQLTCMCSPLSEHCPSKYSQSVINILMLMLAQPCCPVLRWDVRPCCYGTTLRQTCLDLHGMLMAQDQASACSLFLCPRGGRGEGGGGNLTRHHYPSG